VLIYSELPKRHRCWNRMTVQFITKMFVYRFWS
jgi:hypothetical protein